MEDIDAAFVNAGINRDQQKKKSNTNERSTENKGGYVFNAIYLCF